MAQQQARVASALDKVDPVWARIRREAEEIARREPELATFIYSTILHHDTLEAAVIHRVSERLDSAEVSAELIRQAYADALEQIPRSVPRSAPTSWRRSIAIPPPTASSSRVLYFKGFHAIQTHRLAHWLWGRGRKDFAYYLQSRRRPCSRPTSIRPCASGAAFSSTMPPASWSARPRSSRTTCRSCRR